MHEFPSPQPRQDCPTRSSEARRKTFVFLAAVGLVGTPIVSQPADLVLRDGAVITLASGDESTSALAVRGERIAAVGEAALEPALVGPTTRVIELDGRAVLPGFIDAHGHVTLSAQVVGMANVAPPPVGPVDSIEALRAALVEHRERHDVPAGQWVLGFGYDDSLLGERRHPTRTDLDDLFPEHPVALVHVSGHLGVLNSRGLELAEIGPGMPDPEGGLIRREPDTDQPNGVLEENAFFRIYGILPRPDLEASLASLARALDRYASYGITTVQDGATDPSLLPLLREAARRGLLPVDVSVFPQGALLRDEQIDELEFGRYEGRLEVGGVKLMLDGSPQGKTAYLTEPFHVPPHGQDADYRGYPNMPQRDVDALVERYLARGIPVLAHANGDAAADQLIEAVEKAGAKHALGDHRTVVIHAQVTREDQLDSYLRLGMIPSFFSAHTFYWGDWHRDSVLGVERAERISPMRSAQRRGLSFTVHNDAPIVPPDMIRLLWASVNRRTRSGDILGPRQRLDVVTALRAMTAHAAFQTFEEADKGTLEVGKLADLVILSGDPLETAPEDLLDLRVVETFSRGRSVFRAEGQD